jgi:hypothetical protein
VITCTFQRYPVHLIDVVRLGNGSRITVRPALPQDADLQREFTWGVLNRYLSREVRIRNQRRTHHGHLETRSDFLSLTPHGHEGTGREAGLCRGV